MRSSRAPHSCRHEASPGGLPDWPLVRNEGHETAVQSPHGGTKVAHG